MVQQKGKIDSIFNYKSGLLNGESKIFNNGSIVSRSFIRENVLEGKYNLYYPNGKNKTKGHYMDNVPNGKWTWFDEKNNKSRIVNYSMGKMNGPIKVWNDSSFLIMDGAYDQNLKTINGFIMILEAKEIQPFLMLKVKDMENTRLGMITVISVLVAVFLMIKKIKSGTGFQIIRHWILPKHLTWENWMVQLFFHLKMVEQKKN